MANPKQPDEWMGTDSPWAPHGRRWLSGVLSIVALAYAPTLLAGFLADDYFNLVNALDAGWSWSGLSQGFTISATLFTDGWQLPNFGGVMARYFRPLFLASLVGDRALWGLAPWGYHLTSALLHLGVVALLYGVLLEVFGGERNRAAYGALLFGLMHFHLPAVGWLSGRTELLPALAMMAALWGWLRFARAGGALAYALSIAAAAVALPAKENAVVFPFIAFAAWLWIVPRPRRSAWWLLPYAALVALYLPWRYHVLSGFPLPPPSFYYHPPSEPGFLWWALAKAGLLFYGLLFQLPVMCPADLLLAKHPAWVIALLAGAVPLAFWLLRLIWGREEDLWRRRGRFALAWILVGLVPTAPLLVNGLYWYFPAGGLALLYLVIWTRLIERGRPRWLARPRGRKAVLILVPALSALVLEAGNVALIALTRFSDRSLAEIATQIGEPADGTRFHLIDVPPLAYTLKCRLRLRWPRRKFEVDVLTVSSYLKPGPQVVSQLEQLDSRTLRVTTLARPYFAGLIGLIVFRDGERDAIKVGTVWPVHGYRLEITQNEMFGHPPRRCVRQVVFRFDQPLDSPGNVFFRFAGERFERMKFQP